MQGKIELGIPGIVGLEQCSEQYDGRVIYCYIGTLPEEYYRGIQLPDGVYGFHIYCDVGFSWKR